MLTAAVLIRRRALAAVLVVFVAVLAAPTPASAAHGNGQGGADIGGDGHSLTGHVTTTMSTGGTPGTSPTSTSGGVSKCHDSKGAEIPCSMTAGGYDYIASTKCGGSYAAVETSTAAGTLYSCDPTACTTTMLGHPQTAACGWWVPASGTAAPPVDPTQLARTALKRMPLAAPTIHMAPQPPLKTYVGLATWLWIDPGQWRTLTMTVTLRGTSVTVTAAPTQVDWNLTEGSTACDSAGEAWVKGMADNAKSDCSYTFSQVSDFQPNEQFPVTATISYEATWTCSGVCLSAGGDLGLVQSATANSAIRVGEIQTVVTN